ncbi:hypothetical protein [Streptomyces sp. DH24]|uniref:hypothetical protein n=1 Tax=Streptomyces sp. DH24 TaxID=3040123 RepID=UPI002441303F|nr:hypothetical protein [Streptomyces sp. DH24]MDG9719991.1 hypothetical protein [Streptomyces sp. DH24]
MELSDAVAHDEKESFSTAVVTPPMHGWTQAVGPYFGLPYPQRTAHVTDLCRELSTHFGKAQLFFHSEQNDGEAWAIAERGRILRRWVSENPELALGGPFGVERRLLDAYGITGEPEDLDPSSDLAVEWAATWRECWARAAATSPFSVTVSMTCTVVTITAPLTWLASWRRSLEACESARGAQACRRGRLLTASSDGRGRRGVCEV